MIERVSHQSHAAIAQLGERQTEDLKVPGSIPGLGTNVCVHAALETTGIIRFGESATATRTCCKGPLGLMDKASDF